MTLRPRKIKDFRLALADTPFTVFFLCSEGRFMWFENLQSVWASHDMIGKRFSNAFEEADVEILQNAFDQSTGPDDPITVVLRTNRGIYVGDRARTLKVILRRVCTESGERRGALCSSIDITEEIAQIDTNRVLMLEVAHRSKNLLAMVLSLAAQTARNTTNIKTFLARFTGRIQSLAKSQDVITEMNWTGVSWLDLVQQQVSSVVPMGSIRVSINGDNLILSPNASTHIGLALHELVTRSMSMGALSQPNGVVTLTLLSDDDGLERHAVMKWEDNLGQNPAAGTDANDSFSQSLLTRIVPTAVGGNGALTVGDDGLVYELTIQDTDYSR